MYFFHASNVMWTRTVTLVLGKLLSSSWCFLKIYTADKNFTRPPVALVVPNINSVWIYYFHIPNWQQLFLAYPITCIIQPNYSYACEERNTCLMRCELICFNWFLKAFSLGGRKRKRKTNIVEFSFYILTLWQWGW